jgi:glycosyltransferase involved in cell wall biosynthesis
MKLMFFTLAPFSSNLGHLARLSGELKELAKLHKISILCLGEKSNDKQIRKQYRNVSFFHFPVEFQGWEILNLKITVKNIYSFIKKINPDIVILQIEIWDLMRELGKILQEKVKFVTILHAMPFVGAPINPSGDFKNDAINYAYSGIEKYRSEYILKHYNEASEVFNRINIIANNKTVAYYLDKYFQDINFKLFNSPIIIKKNSLSKKDNDLIYDFAYMARMESGKGIEYLPKILKRISMIMGRKITVAILGKADDITSAKILKRLITDSKKSKYFNIKYFGWADKKIKTSVLSKTGVFLYPSIYDTHAVVLCEALSFGLPVITWDILFIRINYSLAKAVISAPLLNFQKFAELAVKTLKKRKSLTYEALNFFNSFDSAKKAAELDSRIYQDIINGRNEKIE